MNVRARRIRVVGPSGSGKSTLAARLAKGLGVVHVELDAHYHQADWKPADPCTFDASVRRALGTKGWVLDGNYTSVLSADVAAGAELIVWLDLPRRVVLPALLNRTLRRGLGRKELWNGNRERVWNLLRLNPEHNLVLFTLQRFERYRTRNFDGMVLGDIPIVRCCTRDEVERVVRLLDESTASVPGRGA